MKSENIKDFAKKYQFKIGESKESLSIPPLPELPKLPQHINLKMKLFPYQETNITKVCKILFGLCKTLKALYQQEHAYAA